MTTAQILEGEFKGEYISIEKIKEYVNTGVIYENGKLIFFDIPKIFIEHMIQERKKRNEIAIKKYEEDNRLWENHSEEMWNNMIYGT